MLGSVDSGKENTKYLSGGKLGTFKTKITTGEEVIKGVDLNSYNLVYNNTLYKVGDTATENSYEVSKDMDIHRISILTALAILKPTYYTGDIKLVTGTPINLFFTEERDSIKEKLLGRHTLLFNNEFIELNISKVLVVPESMGVIYNNYSIYRDKLVKVIDLGGLNSNGCIYKNGVPVRESVVTLNSGINILINKIKNELNRGGYNYQLYEVEYLLKSGSGNARERAVIDEIVNSHLSELQKLMRANNWNIDSGEIVFTGGGSELLKNSISSVFKNANISKEGLYDNVKGFHRIGESLIC